ncbi:A disintegrin and metalloproteinase with thrombospondin motifs 12 isoform X2 [Pleurodeles waltl]|uniref:A disintegrin and metalloproteinase with thrombospondin motifs 12 isoform X2 n=1 Tax=Pleurodeles waltl TaxID=8319 RepID=UPI0037099EC3
MQCIQIRWIASTSFFIQTLYILAVSHSSEHQLGNVYFPDKRQEAFLKSLQDYDVVNPVKVDDAWQFVSFSLHLHSVNARTRRDASTKDTFAYYKIKLKGNYLFFNLTANQRFISDNYILEKRSGNHSRAAIKSHAPALCHLSGTVLESNAVSGPAAISTCHGLIGYFRLPHGDYFIEPVQKYTTEEGTEHPHVIYKRQTSEDTHRHRRSAPKRKSSSCGAKDRINVFPEQKRQRETFVKTNVASRKISQRSVSKERWVETLVVADTKMIEYHGSENVEAYIFTILNMVTGIFHDPTIGNAIHIMLVRLILLEEEEQGLKIIHNADHTLASFCKWQKSVNPKSDAHPTHHDVAVLLTSFGILHDGQANDCEVNGRHPYIMSRQLHYDTSPLTWSHCSKEYITRFLDRGLGFCLNDAPAKTEMKPPIIAPGVLYDVHHQCQLQYGPNATFCEEVDNVCQTLWCSVSGSCRSKLDAAADGTKCGENKWCFTGECVTVGKRPETVNGRWGIWSPWSHCTRTCGAGVESAERQCNNPEPKFGGKYCTGERKRYRMCKVLPCPKDVPSFRHMQCSEFDTVPYKNGLHQWTPIYYKARPCELHCRPMGGNFADKMLDAVIDGTPCFEGTDSRDICINGMCKNVGCDYEINSNATEDRCGVCLGDGSTCQTVRRTFNQSEGFGYVDIGWVPKGARDIRVIEVAAAGNFLAIRGEDPEKNFLNGGFIIQWNGDYKIAGTTFKYDRDGDLENLTASGPTNESLWLQLLFQEANPGIIYEYTIQKVAYKENETEPHYKWQYGRWTDCSVTCGSGLKKQLAYCVKRGKGVVKKTFCDAETQPTARHKKCYEQDCPPRWWTGEWQKCSTTCGPTGEKKRAVLCIQTVGSDEQAVLSDDCHHLLKPKTYMSCNRDVLCPSDWTVSNWTECSVTCGGGVRMRSVACSKNNNEPCDVSKKPNTKALCGLQQCSSRRTSFIPTKIHTVGNITNRKTNRKTLPIPKRRPPGKFLPPKPNSRLLITTNMPTTYAATSTTSYSATHPIPITNLMDKDIKKNNINNSTYLNTEGNAVFTDSKGLQKSTTRTVTNQAIDVNDEQITKVNHLMSEEISTTSQSSFKVTEIQEFSTEDPGVEFDEKEGSTQQNEDELDRQIEPKNISKNTSRRKTPSRSLHIATGRRATSETWATFSRSEFPTLSSYAESSDGMLVSTTNENPTNTDIQISIPVTYSTVTDRPPSKQPSLDRNTTELMNRLNNSMLFVKSFNLHLNNSDWNSRTTTEGNLLESSTNISQAFWIVGNWSECSTSCGLGGVWRDVYCSTMNSSDCQHVKRPDPARTCHLRPCAIWKIGNWSKCSANCGGGLKTREVQCIDAYEKRFMRPFHCHLLGPKPVHSKRCKLEACLQWITTPWDECSKKCGDGIQERRVFCSEVDQCGLKEKPKSTTHCNRNPCTKWQNGTWSSCSSSCGGGTQSRTVTCMNIEHNITEDHHLCEQKEPRPQEHRKCNFQPCNLNTDHQCKVDKMSVNFCQTLKSIGKCAVLNIQTQCCFTCPQRQSVKLRRHTL